MHKKIKNKVKDSIRTKRKKAWIDEAFVVIKVQTTSKKKTKKLIQRIKIYTYL